MIRLFACRVHGLPYILGEISRDNRLTMVSFPKLLYFQHLSGRYPNHGQRMLKEIAFEHKVLDLG